MIFELIPGSRVRSYLRVGSNESEFSPRFVSPACDVVVDAFPRSGSTWVYYNLQLAFPSLKFAHHVHSWQQFLFARLLSIPSIFVTRDPDDAVSSLLTKLGGGAAVYYLEYATMTALSSRLALRTYRFDVVVKDNAKSIRQFLESELRVTAKALDRSSVEQLMVDRTVFKNKKTEPLDIDALGPITKLFRTLAIRAYQGALWRCN